MVLFENLEKKFQNGPKNQTDDKNGKKHISTLYPFIFLHKNVIFDLFLLVLTWNHPKVCVEQTLALILKGSVGGFSFNEIVHQHDNPLKIEV